MWRQPLDEAAVLLDTTQALPAESRPHGRGARAAHRRQLQVADGLRSVARHAAPQAHRRRREVLLTSRAARVRPQLLELAALVRWSSDPNPDCIVELHALLTNGCDSPLYNADVSAEELEATLDRARETLGTPTALSNPTPTSQGGTACQ